MTIKPLHIALLIACLTAACSKTQPTHPTENTPPTNTSTPKPATAPTHDTSLNIDDPSSCEPCHTNIVREWRESMHSRAHHSKDPIYEKLRTLRMHKQGEHIASKCASCHTPRSPKNHDSTTAHTGVSCATCHNIQNLTTNTPPAKAFTWHKDNTLRGPHDLSPKASPAHPTGPAPSWMKDGESLCLTCHNATQNPHGTPTCTTGPEYRKKTSTTDTCVSCHMPNVPTPSGPVSPRKNHASHAFLGPHRAWLQNDPSFLAQSLNIQTAWTPKGLSITVQNLTGHALPSGFPGRALILKVTGLDAQNTPIWNAWNDNPAKEAPSLIFHKIYTDADNKPTLPPFAHNLHLDSRLQPNESRTILLKLPKNVAHAHIQALFSLLPKPAAKTLKLDTSPLSKPKPFLTIKTPVKPPKPSP